MTPRSDPWPKVPDPAQDASLPAQAPSPAPAPPTAADETAGPGVEPPSSPSEPFPPATDSGPPSPAEWKARLREQFEQWLRTVETMPEPSPDTNPEAPSLYDFFAELAALSMESRKANRRTVEAFSRWSDVLDQFRADLGQLREGLHALDRARGERLPRSVCLALIELFDRVERILGAFASPPPRRWLARDRPWREAWQRQQQACDILRDHLGRLLRQQGIERVRVLGEPFNPELMTAVAVEPDASRPPQTVIEEHLSAYVRQGEVLRLAQVRVSIHPHCPSAAPGPSAPGTSSDEGFTP